MSKVLKFRNTETLAFEAPKCRIPVLCLAALVSLGFWTITIWRLGGMWSSLPEYSYGWAVPMLCVILLLDRWRTRPAVAAGGFNAFLFGSILAALAVYSIARLAIEVNPVWRLMAWGLALATLVISFITLVVAGGTKFARHFFFPVAFFLLAVPWHTRFEVPFIQALTELNAALTVEVMAFLEVAAVRMGNIILIEPGMVGVQEACSGIRSFQSTLMMALFLGELFRFSFWRRTVFVLAGAALSFLFNIVRTSFLVWTCNKEGLQAVDKFHDPAGWTILAASVAGLALIGWLLYRQQRSLLRAGETVSGGRTRCAPSSSPVVSSPVVSGPVVRGPWSRGLVALTVILLFALLGTEFGLRWWFAAHERSTRDNVVDWAAAFPREGRGEQGAGTGGQGAGVNPLGFSPLKISREVQGMLQYNDGGGWEWQGGGGDRWQSFLFKWNKPETLAQQILSSAQAFGHQPELCFTRAGMQVRNIYGKKRYAANGVPLVFKVYEFADRNIPIFVFACTWERDAEQTTTEEEQLSGDASTSRGFRQAIHQLVRGERGITDEVRVLKFGVWGPRTIAEAEAAFQQQLDQLIFPVPAAGKQKED